MVAAQKPEKKPETLEQVQAEMGNYVSSPANMVVRTKVSEAMDKVTELKDAKLGRALFDDFRATFDPEMKRIDDKYRNKFSPAAREEKGKELTALMKNMDDWSASVADRTHPLLQEAEPAKQEPENGFVEPAPAKEGQEASGRQPEDAKAKMPPPQGGSGWVEPKVPEAKPQVPVVPKPSAPEQKPVETLQAVVGVQAFNGTTESYNEMVASGGWTLAVIGRPSYSGMNNCPNCDAFKPVIEGFALESKYAGKINFLTVDVVQNRNIENDIVPNITYPYVVLYKDGKAVGSFDGTAGIYTDKALEKWLDQRVK